MYIISEIIKKTITEEYKKKTKSNVYTHTTKAKSQSVDLGLLIRNSRISKALEMYLTTYFESSGTLRSHAKFSSSVLCLKSLLMFWALSKRRPLMDRPQIIANFKFHWLIITSSVMSLDQNSVLSVLRILSVHLSESYIPLSHGKGLSI